MSIHTEIKALAGNSPAAYVSVSFLRALALDTFLDAITRIRGTPIATGQMVLSATLVDATFSGMLTPTLDKFPTARADQIGMLLNVDLTVSVAIVPTARTTQRVSLIEVVFEDIRVNISAQRNRLLVEDAVFTVTHRVTREANADATLAAEGIDPLEAARVEGHIAYGVVTSALGRSLGQRKEMDLSEVFPSFDLGSRISLHPIEVGKYVALVPGPDFRLLETPCACAGPDLQLAPGTATVTNIPPNPSVNDEIGRVTVGGPLPERIDPLRDLGLRSRGFGEVGVYLPQTIQAAMTTRVMPAILIDASDNGFIGFDARGTVGFSNGTVTLDPVAAGIIVTIDLDISVQAICSLDMGKGIRLPIGVALIRPEPGTRAFVEIGFYPVVDGSEIRLKAVLNRIDTGQYLVLVLGVGTALEIIGVTAWIGFLIDVVLSLVVRNNLPHLLRREIKSRMAESEWRLIAVDDVLSIINPSRIDATELHDVDGDTLLVSYDHRAG